jgi:alpha-beta hydrolase superfamily lysophospholipase
MTFRLATTVLMLCCMGGCDFSRTFFPVDERPGKTISERNESIILYSADGTAIHHVLIKPRSETRGTILVFHGSGSTVANWAPLLQPLVDAGFQLFLMEYRGFGLSEGEASHQSVLADAQRALRHLAARDDVAGMPLVVLGQSYGGQLAINVAAGYPQYVDGLVTEGTFTSFQEMAVYSTPWIGKPITRAVFLEPYRAIELIGDATMPKLIIHSEEDETVPFFMGQALFDHAAEEKAFWKIEGKHTDALADYPDEFVSRIENLSGAAPAR